ncbi:hypothetical protein Syun_020678 [Stephania yunnanensis]|uniref:Uncharacterized protein n=1 Tax=Stephania yunnanensis TaxID=152371 RepID=A0AAP0IFJ6_9MAGN
MSKQINETQLYIFVVGRDDKGRTYELGWTPKGRHDVGASSSQLMYAHYETIEQLRSDFERVQGQLLAVIRERNMLIRTNCGRCGSHTEE